MMMWVVMQVLVIWEVPLMMTWEVVVVLVMVVLVMWEMALMQGEVTVTETVANTLSNKHC